MFLTQKKVVKIHEDINNNGKVKLQECHDDDKMDYQKVLQSLESGCLYLDTSDDNSQTEVVTRKRMRLHSLSWEEKIQRKKMRNRIAAQTSRDRKKAKMDHLEESVKELQDKNDILSLQVSELKRQNESLLDANKELQKLLSTRSLTCTCQMISSQNQTCVEEDLPFDRPAESTLPQQKGIRSTSAQSLTATSLILWKILTVYLLSLRCWQMSRERKSSMTWSDWQQVCFKKLNGMTADELQKIWRTRTQEIADSNAIFLLKWWGRHQKSWRPVEMVQAAS